MRKRCTLAYIVAIMMVFTLLAPVFNAPTAQAYGIPNIVDEMNKIIPYLDPAEKEAIGAARDALGEISSEDWDTVLGIGTDNNLLTDAVIAKFDGETDDAKKAAAKAALIQVGIDLGQIYYLQDGQALENALQAFKDNNIDTFQKLFGSETTVDDLYQLMEATRGQFAEVVKNPGYFNDLAFGSDEDLVNTIPDVINAAMQNALKDESKPKLTRFRGKLETIGWSTDKLINQQKELGNIIDPSKAARLALAKAAVRSESELFYDDNGTRVLIPKGQDTKINVNLSKDDEVVYALKIMGQEAATTMVEWESSNPAVASVAYGDGTTHIQDYPVVTANTAGTTTITAYRYDQKTFPEGTAANDWVLKFDVTVDAPPVTVTGISIKTAPTKVTYNAGETLDLTGLVVTLTKSDSSSEDVALENFVANGITASPANQAILATTDTKVILTHTASGKSVEQEITVNQVETKYAITVADVVGGTATVTTDATEATGGTTVTVSIAGIEAGKQFKSITVTDADSGVVATTEVTAGASYTFIMPAKAVTVAVEVEAIPVEQVTVSNVVAATNLGKIKFDTDKATTAEDLAGKIKANGVAVTDFGTPSKGAAGINWNAIIPDAVNNQVYTITCELPFVLTGNDTVQWAVVYGDVNNDGIINVTDAVLVLKHITDQSTLNAQQQQAADVNGDKIINITDALLILKHITDPNTPFPIETP